MKVELASLLELGRAERLQLVEDLWESLAKEDSGAPVPEWKEKELRRRKERFVQNPDSGITWDQVKMSARSQNA